jgi:hypothetical protein
LVRINCQQGRNLAATIVARCTGSPDAPMTIGIVRVASKAARDVLLAAYHAASQPRAAATVSRN